MLEHFWIGLKPPVSPADTIQSRRDPRRHGLAAAVAGDRLTSGSLRLSKPAGHDRHAEETARLATPVEVSLRLDAAEKVEMALRRGSL
jgi:hypothetical protein